MRKLKKLSQKKFPLCSSLALVDLNILEDWWDRIKYDELYYKCISLTRLVWVISINTYPNKLIYQFLTILPRVLVQKIKQS